MRAPELVEIDSQLDAARAAERVEGVDRHELRRRVNELEAELSREPGERNATTAEAVALIEGIRIVNGRATFQHPEVGALLKGPEFKGARSNCTGTLIGCDIFLTANHCLRDGRSPTDYHVFFQHAGDISVEAISPQHRDFRMPHADLALVRLSQEVPWLPLASLSEVSFPTGTSGKILGFGRTGGASQGRGVKRLGTIVTAPCSHPASALICWDFGAPLGVRGEDANTCTGDSGGPLFVRSGDHTVLAGVTSDGTQPDCLAGDHSYDVDVSRFRGWLHDRMAELRAAAPPCDSTGPRFQDLTILAEDGQLTQGALRDHHFQVPNGIDRMIVALNGEDQPRTDFNLFVRRGAPASSARHDCGRSERGNYAVCRFDRPEDGTWHVRVDQQKPDLGAYQLVVTMFPRE